MSIRTPFMTLGLTLAVVASASAQKVTTDWDHATDWSKYKTYYIEIQKPWGNQLGEERAIAATDSALKSRGWTRVQSLDQANAAVLINGVKQQQESATTMYSGGGYGGWGYGGWGGGGMQTATTSTSTWNVGTLIVDIFDVQSKQLLFRGQGQATISDNAEQEHQERVQGPGEDVQGLPADRRRSNASPEYERRPQHIATGRRFAFRSVTAQWM